MHKARLLNEQAEWAGVIDSVERALEKGGLEEGGDVYMLKGMAHAELGQYDAALEAFEEAKSFDEGTRRNADAWIAFVRDRQQVAMNQR
jgi:tetratricopeptide (TPR) repeat protein